MSYRTPLSRIRGLGSARHGAQHWWHERVSSIAAVPLTLFLVWYIVSHLGATRAEIVAGMKNPFIAAGFLLSLMILLWHMKLGMQAIIEDYVHGAWKVPLLLANSFFVAILGALSLYAIAVMSLGG